MKSIIILVGAPGSGKGTQANILTQKHGYVSISTGQLIRNEVKSGSPEGKKMNRIVSKGHLLPDTVTFALLRQELLRLNNNKIILDGFPRTLKQVLLYDDWIKTDEGKEFAVSKVIVLDLDQNEIAKRIVNRIICSKCGATYNMLSKPPLQKNICDVCGSPLQMRSDDTDINIISYRIKKYNNEVKSIVDFYSHKQLVEDVDASKDIESINKDVLNILKI